jgi:hypothetical protein
MAGTTSMGAWPTPPTVPPLMWDVLAFGRPPAHRHIPQTTMATPAPLPSHPRALASARSWGWNRKRGIAHVERVAMCWVDRVCSSCEDLRTHPDGQEAHILRVRVRVRVRVRAKTLTFVRYAIYSGVRTRQLWSDSDEEVGDIGVPAHPPVPCFDQPHSPQPPPPPHPTNHPHLLSGGVACHPKLQPCIQDQGQRMCSSSLSSFLRLCAPVDTRFVTLFT